MPSVKASRPERLPRPGGRLRNHPFRAAVAAVILTVVLPGCSSPEPMTAESNLRLTDEEAKIRWTIDRRDHGQILKAMRSVAPDHRPAERPAPAPHGVRWGDVPAAAFYAAQEAEMAIIRTEPEVDAANDEVRRFTFTLRTIDDRPATLVVERKPEPDIFVATATCGRFGDQEAWAARLVEAFEKKMIAFGRKREWDVEE